ncbi:MAG TPA: cytochrome c3 family protein [Bryobacteraceae bacterium]|nr:cytochrome c3 family protein [Bryobacteraceae bacterium]
MLRTCFGGGVLAITGTFCIAAHAAMRCATCHPKETSRFLASPMGRSLGPPNPLLPGRVRQESSGSDISIEIQGGRMIHRLSERGLTAEYSIAYQIGSGVRGRSYVVDIGNYLLESPISWYRDHGWDISPGYEGMQLIDFDRTVTESCLFCHSGRAKFTDADKRRIAPESVTAITCERCHGNGEDHMRHPSASNIVNPAKLSADARDSICEQCHLEGETRVVNPGKSIESFRAGDKLTNTLVTYLYEEAGERHPAVSQVEELAASRCARVSGDKLWCGSCHDPHGERVDRARQVKALCTSCHPRLSPAAHPAELKECVSCHMPPRPTSNIAHVAVTDHRIHRPGDTEQFPINSADSVFAWRPAPPQFQQRDLALAELQIGSEHHLPTMIQDGVRLLESLPEKQQNNDPDALSLLQSIYLNTSAPPKALALSEWAEASEPDSATFAMNLGIALKRAGDTRRAEAQLLRAIDLDPSMMQAYAELAVLYDEEHRADDARKTIDRFLNWNPQSIQFRLAHRP